MLQENGRRKRIKREIECSTERETAEKRIQFELKKRTEGHVTPLFLSSNLSSLQRLLQIQPETMLHQ